MKSYKVLFVGSPGSGKTTAIRSISEIDVVDTDTQVSDSTIKRKRTTTVGMDYGKISLSEDQVLHLYGTPGQERFKFMWELMVSDLAKDASSLILLVDNTRNYPLKDLDFYLNEFRDYIESRYFVVGVTRSDLDDTTKPEQYRNHLKGLGILAPVIFLDARKPMHVLDLISSAMMHDAPDVNWSDLSHKVAMQELKKRNPDPNSPQFEWLQKSRPVPKMSIVEAAMQSRGVLGASHYVNDKVVDHALMDDKLSDLTETIKNVMETINTKTGEKLPDITDVSVFGHKQDTISLFKEENQTIGLVTNPYMTYQQIRQQARDLLQWSDNVRDTQ
jgi:signal recognition particle receptor subunit beta